MYRSGKRAAIESRWLVGAVVFLSAVFATESELTPLEFFASGFAPMSVAMAVGGVGQAVDALAVVRFALRAKHRMSSSPPCWVGFKYFGSGNLRRQTINPKVGLLTAAFAAAMVGVFVIGLSPSLSSVVVGLSLSLSCCVLSVVVGSSPSLSCCRVSCRELSRCFSSYSLHSWRNMSNLWNKSWSLVQVSSWVFAACVVVSFSLPGSLRRRSTVGQISMVARTKVYWFCVAIYLAFSFLKSVNLWNELSR